MMTTRNINGPGSSGRSFNANDYYYNHGKSAPPNNSNKESGKNHKNFELNKKQKNCESSNKPSKNHKHCEFNNKPSGNQESYKLTEKPNKNQQHCQSSINPNKKQESRSSSVDSYARAKARKAQLKSLYLEDQELLQDDLVNKVHGVLSSDNINHISVRKIHQEVFGSKDSQNNKLLSKLKAMSQKKDIFRILTTQTDPVDEMGPIEIPSYYIRYKENTNRVSSTSDKEAKVSKPKKPVSPDEFMATLRNFIHRYIEPSHGIEPLFAPCIPTPDDASSNSSTLIILPNPRRPEFLRIFDGHRVFDVLPQDILLIHPTPVEKTVVKMPEVEESVIEKPRRHYAKRNSSKKPKEFNRSGGKKQRIINDEPKVNKSVPKKLTTKIEKSKERQRNGAGSKRSAPKAHIKEDASIWRPSSPSVLPASPPLEAKSATLDNSYKNIEEMNSLQSSTSAIKTLSTGPNPECSTKSFIENREANSMQSSSNSNGNLNVNSNLDVDPQNPQRKLYWKKTMRFSQYFDMSYRNSLNSNNSASSTVSSINGSVDEQTRNGNVASNHSENSETPSGILSSPASPDPEPETDPEVNFLDNRKLKVIDLANNYSMPEHDMVRRENEILATGQNENWKTHKSFVSGRKKHRIDTCQCGDAEVASIRSLNSSSDDSQASSPRSYSSVDSDIEINNKESSDESDDDSKMFNGNGYHNHADEDSMDTPVMSDSSEVVHSDASSPISHRPVVVNNSGSKNRKSFKRSDFSESEISDEIESKKAKTNKKNKTSKMDQYKEINNNNDDDLPITNGFASDSVKSPKGRKSVSYKNTNGHSEPKGRKYSKRVDEENDQSTSCTMHIQTNENPPKSVVAKPEERQETDEELARRLQLEEYQAARPARRRVAIVAYDRLHEQLSGFKRDPVIDGDRPKKSKPIAKKRASANNDSEQEDSDEDYDDEQEKNRKRKRIVKKKEKPNDQVGVVEFSPVQDLEKIADYFGTSVTAPQQICSRLLEYASQNNLVFTESSSYYLKCDRTLSNLFGVPGPMRAFDMTRLIYKLASPYVNQDE